MSDIDQLSSQVEDGGGEFDRKVVTGCSADHAGSVEIVRAPIWLPMSHRSN